MSNAASEPTHRPTEGEIETIPIVIDDEADKVPSDTAKNPSNADLLALADRFPAPQEWYDE